MNRYLFELGFKLDAAICLAAGHDFAENNYLPAEQKVTILKKLYARQPVTTLKNYMPGSQTKLLKS